MQTERALRVNIAVHVTLFVFTITLALLILAYPANPQDSARDAKQDAEIDGLKARVDEMRQDHARKDTVTELAARIGRIEGFGIGIFAAVLAGQGLSVIIVMRTHRVVKRNGR